MASKTLATCSAKTLGRLMLGVGLLLGCVPIVAADPGVILCRYPKPAGLLRPCPCFGYFPTQWQPWQMACPSANNWPGTDVPALPQPTPIPAGTGPKPSPATTPPAPMPSSPTIPAAASMTPIKVASASPAPPTIPAPAATSPAILWAPPVPPLPPVAPPSLPPTAASRSGHG
jgi:hypothetical protein